MDVTCYLVSPIGCCSGVKRAIGMAEQVLKMYKEAYIIEDVVHNNVVMQKMFDAGLKKVSNIDEIPDGSVVLFSVHGVAPSIVEMCEQKGLTIVDATCSVVQTIQESIKKSAAQKQKIVIIGNRYHPEVIGFLGCARDTDAFVVNSEEEVGMLPDFQDCGVTYYTQTTLRIDKATPVISALKNRYPNIARENETDLCCGTYNRQIAIIEIAKNMDLVIVLGSRSSANTTYLAELAEEYGAKNVLFVDQISEIEASVFNNVSNIAVATGASTPEYIVDETLDFLKSIIENVNIQEIAQNRICNED